MEDMCKSNCICKKITRYKIQLDFPCVTTMSEQVNHVNNGLELLHGKLVIC